VLLLAAQEHSNAVQLLLVQEHRKQLEGKRLALRVLWDKLI
jgi:hypothetical protein